MNLNTILNYIKINDNISTSGQPTEAQFEIILKHDFDVVINLALCNASNAIANEDKVVTSLGMTYIHIPVEFENPTIDNLKLFLTILSSLKEKKVYVHCALNYRASAFMYIYHKYFLQTPFNEIDLSMMQEWSPDKKWQELMKTSFDEL